MKKPFFAYRSFWKEFGAMRNFARIGVREFCIFAGHSANSLGEPYSQYDPIWKWYGKYDFKPLDEQVEDLLQICPDARIICMIDINSPLWLARQLQIDSYSQLSGTLCNKIWCQETAKYLEAFVNYSELHYGDRIDSYVIMCGKTDEWMDVSHGMETPEIFEAYSEWCSRKELPPPDDVPTIKQKNNAIPVPGGYFIRSPEQSENAITYWNFISSLIASKIAFFTGIVRKLARKETQIGVFYGYQIQLRCMACNLGHLAYQEVESCPSVDFVISPGIYADREMGGNSGFMTPNGTVHLHGKNCLYEIDHRTTSANMKLTQFVSLDWMNAWKSPMEDIAGLRREFCRTLFHGASLWWFDMWGGFFTEKHQLHTIEICRSIWEKYADTAFQPEAEIALVIDPDSALYIKACKENDKVYQSYYSLNRIGAPYQVYTLQDWRKLPSKIKFVIFDSIAKIAPAELEELRKKLLSRVSCCWCGPCGVTDGKKMICQPLPGKLITHLNEATPEALRTEAEKAGVHFFTDKLLPVWYGRNLLMVHTAEGGNLKISLPHNAGKVTELFSAWNSALDGNTFHFCFDSPDTRLFLLE